MGKVYSLSILLGEADDWSRYIIYGLKLKTRSCLLDLPLLRTVGGPHMFELGKDFVDLDNLGCGFSIGVCLLPWPGSWSVDILVVLCFFHELLKVLHPRGAVVGCVPRSENLVYVLGLSLRS
ncbi:hypothetical protein ACFX1T_009652 [Malus domestica]